MHVLSTYWSTNARTTIGASRALLADAWVGFVGWCLILKSNVAIDWVGPQFHQVSKFNVNAKFGLSYCILSLVWPSIACFFFPFFAQWPSQCSQCSYRLNANSINGRKIKFKRDLSKVLHNALKSIQMQFIRPHGYWSKFEVWVY